ncbi:LLM class flavin-dependent oxidoreductase [Nocardioides marinus]|uniref:Alkanesulfonate monooxygenase SsuD/methylene tetrahydromethanopterin reductase-like flavin-dependent oxidoreductase (Luciferase family) n=1 Tax=Nocardioides marinus TaxID=374514 RepID=A0A7Z0C2C3_9ACTN|nr:LLM class flavin-dependent oxidoreductase [Nocardioides marinus]NYI10705.1 alkanesulfonate monooxygenase SsuD/methylene tetrahydromethanopterin reductase-like flavin-dependent oxidoreductase (luciferase family) [Nocardioides marinus]
MRIGITVLTDLPWREAAPRWRAAEEMGFAHAWTYDHLVWGGLPDAPWRAATPVLGAVAATTSRIGLGTLVASPNFRHPYQLLREAQALEDVSDGRFLLGLGTGGDLDSRLLAQPELTVRERVDRFQEDVDLLLRLRAEDHVDADGRWFSVRDARTLPPLARTPLLVAGSGPRSVRYAARVGDGWVTTGPPADTVEEWVAGLAAASRVLDEALEGRELPRYVLLDSAGTLFGGDGRTSLSSVEFFTDLVGRVGGLGFTDAITHWPRPEPPYAASERVLEQVAALLPTL